MTNVQCRDHFSNVAFSGRPDSVSAFVEAVERRLPMRDSLRVLDLGCGVGDIVIALADKRRDIDITGMDISAENVARAQANAATLLASIRPKFSVGDFRSWSDGEFDVVTADSVLQLIPMADEEFAARLARMLTPGGLLMTAMPAEGWRNSALILQRRMWALTPTSFDAAAMALARAIHPKETANILEDRIAYLRIIPERQFGPSFVQHMNHAGLTVRETLPWPGGSAFKLRHQFVVFQKSN